MITEVEVCRRLFQFLKGKGYPENALAFEYVIETPYSAGGGKRYYAVDAAVLEETTGIPLAFFEVKSCADKQTISKAMEQLNVYSSQMHIPVRMYLVIPNDNQGMLKIADVSPSIFKLGSGEREKLVFLEGKQLDAEFPTYDLLIKGVFNKVSVEREKSFGRKLNHFKVVSNVVTVVMFLLFLVDFCGHGFSLRWENLALLGAVAIVSLAPYYEGIKYNGWSLLQKKTDMYKPS